MEIIKFIKLINAENWILNIDNLKVVCKRKAEEVEFEESLFALSLLAVIKIIFKFADVDTLKICRLTCKKYQQIIDQDFLIQEIVAHDVEKKLNRFLQIVDLEQYFKVMRML